MKKHIFAIIASALLLSPCTFADFEKSSSYTDGQFSDVHDSEWYASSVKDAYEFGLMNGNSNATFNPLGTLTVAEGITITSRIHATANGKDIPDAEGEWYEKYVNYAIANGLMENGQFDGYDLNIKRFEIAELFAAASGNLPVINDVTDLPDVASGIDYADAVFKLYNAGVLAGNDSYGTFAPNSYLLRSEISAMAVRIADSTKRVKKDFDKVEARAFSDSYHIIEAVGPSGRNGLANGWNYDNRFDLYNTTGVDKTTVSDASDEKFYSLKRDFDAEYEGLLHFELVANVSSGDNGAYVSFEAPDGERILELTAENGVWIVRGTNEASTDVEIFAYRTRAFAITAEIDLDNNTASVMINNKKCGSVSIKDDAVLSRLVLGTNKIGKGVISLNHARLVKNRPMNEHFLITENEAGQKPAAWNVSGDFVLAKIASVKGQDVYSVKADSKAGTVSTAKKSFIPMTGKVCFETFVLFPEKTDGGKVALMSGATEVFAFETKNGKIVMGDTELHDYIPNVWQCLHIEADTNTGKAVIKINGKEKAEVDFNARVFDGVNIEFAPDTDAVMWFDDVEIYNLIDHADYPSEPVVAESTDYNVGINVCYLWRDSQSGEGWDSTSPFPEFDTYLGFYDEGLRETADWELKMMAEHGIDFMHVCWYCPNGDQTAPIKRMRVSYGALHDGYMNAEYSDLVDFCIMWENNGQDVTSFEQFKQYIWPYWKEYYFADERYARLDNKAVLSVWNRDKMQSAFGGVEGMNKAVAFMNEELIEMGYDGIILLGTNASMASKAYYEGFDAIGFDTTYAYNYGRTGYDPQYQIDRNRNNTTVSKGFSHHIPTISVGFNDVGRNESRHPIITGEDFLRVCEDSKDILSEYNTGTWKDNTVILSTWNEYSEGTYIMPCEGNGGYTYLEAVRKAFTNDTSDHSGIDVKLTETQLGRTGHLYPANHSPIRWHQFERADGAENIENIDLSTLVPVQTYDMKNAEDRGAWKAMFGLDSYESADGYIGGSATVNDYAITTTEFAMLKAKDAPIIHVRMKTDAASNFEIFFITSEDAIWNSKKYMSHPITKTGEYVDYYVNMNLCGKWTDTILEIRFDPMTNPGSFEIALIEFMNFPQEALDAIPRVTVNATELGFTFNPTPTSDGDFEVVGEARHLGFYSSMRLYHEWDRFTGDGVLTLYDRYENKYVFTVGSDKVLVNGKEQALGYTFKIRDGLPVFHIKKLCDLLNYKYTVDGNKINIIAATDEEYEHIASRVPNEWEFDVGGETDGWTAQGGTVTTYDGMLTLTCSHFDLAVIRNVFISATDYTHVVVGVVYQKELIDSSTPQLFFTTRTSGTYTADKCINGVYKTEGKKDGDIVEAVFDLNDNSKFMGTITGLRFDPYNKLSDLKVDYIRCVNDPSLTPGDTLIEVDDENQWYFDNGDLEGWGTKGDAYTITDGVVSVTATNNDPGMVRSVSFDASAYQYMVVGVKYDDKMKSNGGEMFFITEADPTWAADKGVSGRYSVTSSSTYGDTIEIKLDLTQNSRWTGTVKGIRFDPYSIMADYEIDYIRLYKKG